MHQHTLDVKYWSNANQGNVFHIHAEMAPAVYTWLLN